MSGGKKRSLQRKVDQSLMKSEELAPVQNGEEVKAPAKARGALAKIAAASPNAIKSRNSAIA